MAEPGKQAIEHEVEADHAQQAEGVRGEDHEGVPGDGEDRRDRVDREHQVEGGDLTSAASRGVAIRRPSRAVARRDAVVVLGDRNPRRSRRIARVGSVDLLAPVPGDLTAVNRSSAPST